VVCLARGIRPLAQLQQRIRQRESTDLSPLAVADVPDEVAPLVRAINDLLQRLDRTIATQRHFLADAAHQLKTPLAGLRMQAELAAREIDSGRGDPASMKHSLRQIALSTQRAAHMVNQLLAMARAEDTGQVMRKTPVDLAAITRAVVRDFVPRSIERQIDLGYEGPERADGSRLMGEPVLLGELVRNLVDNACTTRPAAARSRHGCWPTAGAPDRGAAGGRHRPGHRPAEREAVFRPFYRALGTQVDGSGLGLAIVQEIAQHHDCRDHGGRRAPPQRRHSGAAGHGVHCGSLCAARRGAAGHAATSSRRHGAGVELQPRRQRLTCRGASRGPAASP
jgi:two-component system sensor histidine kinase TctE